MGLSLCVKMRLLVFVFYLLSLPKYMKANSEINETIWDEIERICPSQSCKNTDSRTKWCSCDSNCIKFHDCCIDKIVDFKDKLEEEPHIYRVQCIRTPSLGLSFQVSSCRNDTGNISTDANSRLCTKASQVISHILDIPVTSSFTGLTYRNVHCAVCNEDARHLVPRKSMLEIDPSRGSPATNPSDWAYEDGSLTWKWNPGDQPLDRQENNPGNEYPFGYVLLKQMEYGSGETTESSKVAEESHGLFVIADESNFPNIEILVTDDSFKASEGFSESVDEDAEVKEVLKGRILSDRDVEGRRKSNFSRKVVIEKEVAGEDGQSEKVVEVGYEVRSKLLLDDEFIRRCPVSSMTGTCDQARTDWTDESAIWCASYSMPVYTLQEREGTAEMVFRNPHCAICNHVAVEHLKCLNFGEKKQKVKGETEELVFSFGDALVGDKRCGARSVWDPLFRRCYFLDGEEEVGPNDSRRTGVTEPQMVDVEMELPGTLDYAHDGYCDNSTLLTLTKVQWYLASAFFGVSVVCLGFHVVIQACTRRSSDTSSNCLEKRLDPLERKHITDRSFHILAWLLFLGQVLFIAGSRQSEMRVVCVAIAVAHNFLSLAAISWLSVFCLQVFQSFFSINNLKSTKSPSSEPQGPSLKLTLIAWIIPMIFSSLCLTLELVPGNLRSCLARGGACWYGDSVSFRILFILPALLMLAGDGCIFTAIIFGIREKREGNANTPTRSKNNSQLSRRRSSSIVYNDHRRFRLCARIGLLMAISWSCAAAASLGGLPPIWYGFVIFSGLQGVFIFVSSGAKSKLLHIICVKATGKPLTIGEENVNKKKNARSDTNEIPSVCIQK